MSYCTVNHGHTKHANNEFMLSEVTFIPPDLNSVNILDITNHVYNESKSLVIAYLYSYQSNLSVKLFYCGSFILLNVSDKDVLSIREYISLNYLFILIF